MLDHLARLEWNYEIRLERETYAITIEEGRLAELARRQPSLPVDATLATDRFTMLALLTQGASLPAAVKGGKATVRGDARALKRLLAAIPDLALRPSATEGEQARGRVRRSAAPPLRTPA